MKYSLLLVLVLALGGCKTNNSSETKTVVEFEQALADELAQMAEIDQIAAYIPQGEYEKLSPEEWNAFKDSVFQTHQKRLAEIIDEKGYPGIDRIGEEGEQNFWLMTQHADFNPEFQQQVLDLLAVEVENENANARNFGLLTDRVRLNTGKKQVYGTQVTYNMEIGQAIPQPLEDSLDVNDRRLKLGFEPIEEYLNQMTEMHFEMNKDYYASVGVTEPTFHTVEEAPE